MSNTQTYANHTRWYPFVHFFITPLLLINLILALVCSIQEFEWFRLQYLLLSFLVLMVSFAGRLQALKAQDRLIRLEERLRYRDLLPKELVERAGVLRTRQMIALRFAPDEELEGLVKRVLDGELTDSKEIKQAIKNWKGDYLRV